MTGGDGGGGATLGRQGSSATRAGNTSGSTAAVLCASPASAARPDGMAAAVQPQDKHPEAVPVSTQSPRSHNGLASPYGAPSGATSATAPAAMRTAPPDPFSLVCRNATTAANLQAGDLLALPVSGHGTGDF